MPTRQRCPRRHRGGRALRPTPPHVDANLMEEGRATEQHSPRRPRRRPARGCRWPPRSPQRDARPRRRRGGGAPPGATSTTGDEELSAGSTPKHVSKPRTPRRAAAQRRRRSRRPAGRRMVRSASTTKHGRLGEHALGRLAARRRSRRPPRSVSVPVAEVSMWSIYLVHRPSTRETQTHDASSVPFAGAPSTSLLPGGLHFDVGHAGRPRGCSVAGRPWTQNWPWMYWQVARGPGLPTGYSILAPGPHECASPCAPPWRSDMTTRVSGSEKKCPACSAGAGRPRCPALPKCPKHSHPSPERR